MELILDLETWRFNTICLYNLEMDVVKAVRSVRWWATVLLYQTFQSAPLSHRLRNVLLWMGMEEIARAHSHCFPLHDLYVYCTSVRAFLTWHVIRFIVGCCYENRFHLFRSSYVLNLMLSDHISCNYLTSSELLWHECHISQSNQLSAHVSLVRHCPHQLLWECHWKIGWQTQSRAMN